MRLGILRSHSLAAANVAQVLLGAAWVPMWFFLNLYLQQVLGLGAFEGGSALLPMTLAIMLGMVVVAPRVMARLGAKPMVVGGLFGAHHGVTVIAVHGGPRLRGAHRPRTKASTGPRSAEPSAHSSPAESTVGGGSGGALVVVERPEHVRGQSSAQPGPVAWDAFDFQAAADGLDAVDEAAKA